MAQAYARPQQGQGISREVGGKDAPAGLWRHPESGETAITQDDPLFGNAQSQGFLQLGFVYERPAEPGEVKTLPELAMEARATDEEAVKGLSARLGALESVASDNEKLQAEIAELRAEKKARETADAQAAEKAAAAKAKKADAKPAAKPKTKESETK